MRRLVSFVSAAAVAYESLNLGEDGRVGVVMFERGDFPTFVDFGSSSRFGVTLSRAQIPIFLMELFRQILLLCKNSGGPLEASEACYVASGIEASLGLGQVLPRSSNINFLYNEYLIHIV